MILREIGGELVHELGTDDISNVDGDGSYVRVQVLTNASVLTREKQLATVEQLTAIVAAAAGDPTLADRTWVLLIEAPDGGWGLKGHGNTNEGLVLAARAQLAELSVGESVMHGMTRSTERTRSYRTVAASVKPSTKEL
jgi:phenylpyruvate tautomerase PptA (4-oxalocrotonate tautomerase family)